MKGKEKQKVTKKTGSRRARTIEDDITQFSIMDFDKLIPDEKTAIAVFEHLRWEGRMFCPYCNSENVYTCEGNHSPLPHRCRDCKKYFSVRTGTILARSKIPLRDWLIAIYLLMSSSKGVSSIQMGKLLGKTQKSAWFLGHRIRKSCFFTKKKLSGCVEADETYIGGLEKNKHATKKLNGGRGAVGKTPIFGMMSRDGNIRAFVVDDTTKKTLAGLIKENVRKGSKLYTDEHRSYYGLKKYYKHSKVNHRKKEYVRGDVHTNNIENFWGLLKRGKNGTYHYWSRKHMQRYVDEFQWRQSLKNLSPYERMVVSVIHGFKRTLSHKELVHGKTA